MLKKGTEATGLTPGFLSISTIPGDLPLLWRMAIEIPLELTVLHTIYGSYFGKIASTEVFCPHS